MRIVAFIIALAFFLAGLGLMGYAFGSGGAAFPMFFGGILLVAVSIIIPVHILKRIDA